MKINYDISEIAALAEVPYTKDYFTAGSKDDSADEDEYMVLFREGESVSLQGRLPLFGAREVRQLADALTKAAADAEKWRAAEVKWTRAQAAGLTKNVELDGRQIAATFRFDAIGAPWPGRYEVSLYTQRGTLHARVYTSDDVPANQRRIYEGALPDGALSEKTAANILRAALLQGAPSEAEKEPAK